MNRFEELEKLLKRHDYTYEMSDDHRCWVNGNAQLEKITALIKELVLEDKQKVGEIIARTKQKYGTQFLVEEPYATMNYAN